jgi:hypothetical protein
MRKVSDFEKSLLEEAAALAAGVDGGSFWPDKYCDFTADTAFEFITRHCYTWNEAEKEYQLLPAKEYVYNCCEAYVETYLAGVPLIVKKSRRIAVSWVFRSLDLWHAGIEKTTQFVAGQTYERSTSMIRRTQILWEQMRQRFPDYNLPRLVHGVHLYRFKGPTMLSKILLPNGSSFDALTGDDPDSFRQEGATRVTCEEIAFWPYLEAAWGNVLAMCMPSGKQGAQRGHAVAISTVQSSKEWRDFTAPAYGTSSDLRVYQDVLRQGGTP